MKTRAQVVAAANAQVPIADFVPYGGHIRPEVIKLKGEDAYVATWRVEGVTFETLDPMQINTYKVGLNNLLKALGGGSFSLWQHKLRRVVRERLGGNYASGFCADLHKGYYGTFDKHQQMRTELYLSLVFRPGASKVLNLFRKLGAPSADDVAARQQEHVDALEDASRQVLSSLSKYTPERLGVYERNGVVFSEQQAFLGYLVNGYWEEIPLARAEVGELLPVSRLHFGDANGSLEIWHPKGKKFAGFLDFKEYPSSSEPGMCDAILYGDYEFIETQSFSILNRREAMKALENQKGQLESTAVPEAAWFAQLPGNWWLRPREATVSSRNFAALSPLHNFARGKRTGNPWGEAIALFPTPSGQPYYFNFHPSPDDKDSSDEKLAGNTFVCGVTGAGKSAVVNSLFGLATKVQGLRAVYFDKDRGTEILIRAMRGQYRAFRRGEPTGFNPFQLPLTQANIAFCEKLIGRLVTPVGQPIVLTAGEEAAISNAVRTTMSESTSWGVRGISAVFQQLPATGENSLKARLKKWTRGQPLGWVLDNPVNTLDLSTNTIFGFDYTEFLDDPELRTPVLAFLLHVTQTLINGKPFIYFMEEFWKPLLDEMFADFVKNKQKTIRKEFGLGVFITQSPSDVVEHAIGKTMVQQSVTQIYLANPRADRKDYVEGFGVTDAEFNIIKNIDESSRLLLVKQGHRSAILKFDLGGLDEILNVVSGSVDNVELLDGIRAEVGDDPDIWLPILHRRIAERKSARKS